MSARADSFRKKILRPWKLKLFMVAKLPMGLLAGLRVVALDETKAAVSIKLGYLTKNPFRSIYFACLAMAAELASGVQGIVLTSDGPPVSMLVVDLKATFTKKAVGRVTFTCADGAAIAEAIAATRADGEGRTVPCTSIGRDETGDEVATFVLTWSFKAKAQKA